MRRDPSASSALFLSALSSRASLWPLFFFPLPLFFLSFFFYSNR